MRFPKFHYVRSEKLLVACRALACQHCGQDDGTVVAAHSNEAAHGKGRSIKASDIYVASLCYRCHMALDQGSRMTKEERQTVWLKAHLKTVAQLIKRGLWPPNIPQPDSATYSIAT